MKKLVGLILVVALVAVSVKAAEPNDANKAKDSKAPKANISMNLTKAACKKTSDANQPKDSNAPKANISIRLATEPVEANKPVKEPNAPKANIVLRLSVEPNAAAPNAGTITVRGRLMVVKDANSGVITSAKLENRRTGTTYNIVLDAKGKELAEKAAGKPVVVIGVESTKGTEKWLTVEKFTEMQRPGPGGPGGPGAPKAPGAPSGGK
jgi:hypothetical protein